MVTAILDTLSAAAREIDWEQAGLAALDIASAIGSAIIRAIF